METILLHSITPEELKKIIKELLKEEFKDFKKYLESNSPDELLTREETCKLLKIDSSTLWSWTKNGKIDCYGIGYRRYYKKSDILSKLVLLKVKRA